MISACANFDLEHDGDVETRRVEAELEADFEHCKELEDRREVRTGRVRGLGLPACDHDRGPRCLALAPLAQGMMVLQHFPA